MASKYKFKISELGDTNDLYLNIPISLTPQFTDQYELVSRKFIDVEVEKSINPIQDYEKARFIPRYSEDTANGIVYSDVKSITYNVRFLGSQDFPNDSRYSDINISNDDIRYSKNRFTKSFLNLSFYSTDKPINQRLLSVISIFPRITDMDIQDETGLNPGLPKPSGEIPVSFKLSNPILNPNGFAEGFYVYNYKDEVTESLPKELYMRARFNNASNGLTTNMMTESEPYYINELVNKIYTKYVLFITSTGYYYEIDDTYSTNISRNNDDIAVNLYEIQAL
jgi:hypothetical protein